MGASRFSSAKDKLSRLVVRLRRPRKIERANDEGYVNIMGAWQTDVVDVNSPGFGAWKVPDEVDVNCPGCHMVYPLHHLSGASCGHLFCRSCLKNNALATIFRVSCLEKGCNSTFDDAHVREILGDEAYQRKHAALNERAARAAQKELDASAARSLHARRHFKCPMCLEEVAKKDAVQLDCGHWHCQDCLKAFLESRISEGQVAENELACPIPGCGKALSEVQIQAIIGQTPLWERFLDFRARIWKPRTLEGCIATCPSPDCERFEVPPGVTFVGCPRCRKSFCVKCSGPAHKGMSCEEYNAWRCEKNAEDRMFAELMQKEAWRRCPKCGMPSHRESGCNFMTCPSSSCRNKTNWCYVCGKELNAFDHLLHFPYGPYMDHCRSMSTMKNVEETTESTLATH